MSTAKRLRSMRTAGTSAAVLMVVSAPFAVAGSIDRVPVTAESGVQAINHDAELSAAATSGRLVPNAGFEESLTEAEGSVAPARWTTEGQPGSVVLDREHARSGRYALLIVDSTKDEEVSVRSQALAVAPGETLTASVYAQRITSGAASGALSLEFYDDTGTRLEPVGPDGTRHNGVVTVDVADTGRWRRIDVAGVAPVHAVTATVRIHSAAEETGTTAWDDMSVVSLAVPERQVPDAGFEENRGNPITSHWTMTGGAAIVAADQHSGRQALQTTDTMSTSESTALSRNVSVAPRSTVSASVWANADAGAAGSLTLEFYDANGLTRDAWKRTVDVEAHGGWQLLTAQGNAPSAARTARLRISSSIAGTGTTMWDDASLRTSVDGGYHPAVGSGSVLFVGDERVESYSGLNRVVHPGTPAGDPALGELGQQGVVIPSTPTGPYPLPNPRPQGAVMATESGYELWTWSGLGGAHLTSTDGVTWPLENRQLTTLTTSAGPTYDQKAGPSSVVRNPRYGQPGQPKYYALRSLPGPVSKRPIPPSGDDPGQVERRAHNYYAFSSDNGVDWVFLDEEHPALIGHDVVNVSYDPVTHRFVASFKQWVHTKSDAGVSHYDRTARTVLVSTSEDFVKWTDPLPALASDMRDYDEVAAAYPGDGGAVETAYGKPVKSSDIYSMPVFRYGEQYLGVPTLFDITYAAREVFPDIGHAHLELASSQNLVNWSRPNRDKLVTPIEDGWNRGFHLADAMISVGDEVWLYYGSFKGKHSCPESAAEPEKGCQPVVDNFGGSQTGRVIWQKDRFVSFHAAPGGGNVTTRPLVPQAHGDSLQVNVATGDGELKIEVLDAKGVPIPGYTLADATPVKGDTLSQTVTWGARSTLPNGPIRLRFSLSAGDLYSYAIS